MPPTLHQFVEPPFALITACMQAGIDSTNLRQSAGVISAHTLGTGGVHCVSRAVLWLGHQFVCKSEHILVDVHVSPPPTGPARGREANGAGVEVPIFYRNLPGGFYRELKTSSD